MPGTTCCWELRFLTRSHAHLDDADQIISGHSLLYHAMLPEDDKLLEERQWNGTKSTVCFETRKQGTKLHLLLRQTKALTSDTHHEHDKHKGRFAQEPDWFTHARFAPFEG
jgi:hypothetical protein